MFNLRHIVENPDSAVLCEQLWESVFSTFTVLLQTGHQESLLHLSPVFVKHWNIITGN